MPSPDEPTSAPGERHEGMVRPKHRHASVLPTPHTPHNPARLAQAAIACARCPPAGPTTKTTSTHRARRLAAPSHAAASLQRDTNRSTPPPSCPTGGRSRHSNKEFKDGDASFIEAPGRDGGFCTGLLDCLLGENQASRGHMQLAPVWRAQQARSIAPPLAPAEPRAPDALRAGRAVCGEAARNRHRQETAASSRWHAQAARVIHPGAPCQEWIRRRLAAHRRTAPARPGHASRGGRARGARRPWGGHGGSVGDFDREGACRRALCSICHPRAAQVPGGGRRISIESSLPYIGYMAAGNWQPQPSARGRTRAPCPSAI